VVPLIGYVDRFSARPGERIAVKGSSRLTEPYQADLVLIVISEVFSTNARASDFGLCQAAGRIAAFVAIPMFLWIQQAYGLNAVFVVIAVIVAIAAIAVTQVGPEARGLALDEIAPPTVEPVETRPRPSAVQPELPGTPRRSSGSLARPRSASEKDR
jgi:hypothetical protein